MKVAFIGLGFMGAQQAESLAGAGFDLTVFDTTPAATERFAGKARIASGVTDAAAGADILCLCVRDDEQVNEVLLGTGGALAALRSGAAVLIHSTIRPDTVTDLARRAAMRGVTVIDAPVSRSEYVSYESKERFLVLQTSCRSVAHSGEQCPALTRNPAKLARGHPRSQAPSVGQLLPRS